ncbi:DUF308 domain-containing protein [Neorhizobium sp. T7_12]|uniref:DUF308 domain-containing protein n=1 Tax=Neorhizobium sp. T7_12 TaxID=2093832 RepID=UPI000CF8C0DE|nr:DUF308 domain-containing protein [Neorhizobium sp. T7_12]
MANVEEGAQPEEHIDGKPAEVDEAPPGNPEKKSISAENNFPADLVRLGIGVGILFVVVGIILLVLDRDRTFSALTICVGFGLVLAAFGSKAGGAWAGWSATGAGAMAIILFLMLIQIGPPKKEIDIVRGRLEGDFSKVADLRIIDEDPLYLYRDRSTSTLKFIMLEKKLRSARLTIQVDTTEFDETKQFFKLMGDAATIQKAYLASAEGNFIQWNFDYANRRVMDGNKVIFSEAGTIMSLADADTRVVKSLPWWSMAAFAETDTLTAPVSPLELRLLMEQLNSDDTYIRRNARDYLAIMGPGAVPLMMGELRKNFRDYRTRLGITYALGEMLRAQPSSSKQISEGIQEADFQLLVAAASDEDKTIRYQAAEFLYNLQDPRAVQPSINAAKEATDEGVANNQILILRQSGSSLPCSQKGNIVRELSDPSTNLNRTFKDPSSLNRVLKW